MRSVVTPDPKRVVFHATGVDLGGRRRRVGMRVPQVPMSAFFALIPGQHRALGALAQPWYAAAMEEPLENDAVSLDASAASSAAKFEASGDPAVANEAAIEVAWQKVEAEWEDEDAHKRFVGLAASLDALPLAGARYRRVRDTDEARSKRAQAGMDKILQVAVSRMELSRSPVQKPPRVALFLIAASLSLGMMAVALWAYLGR